MGNKLEHPDVELPPEKLVMVTGGNTGLGYETARSIAEKGARVCIACRSEDKAKDAIERMQKEHKNEVLKSRSVRASGQPSSTAEEAEVKPLNVEYIKLDLSSLQSTMDFIRETKQRMQSLNVLVCNAGIAFVQQGYTEDNYELHFQVNYLSHILIALHLMPLLRAGAPDSRIVFLSSVAHSSGKLDLDNMQCRKSYSRYGAYASSKAYVVMAACLLARRLKGTGVSTFAVDPGVVNTDIQRNFSDWRLLSFFMGAYSKMGMMRTPKKGAATSVVACIQPSLSGRTAVFMKNCQPANPASFCRDEANQEKLWNYTLGCLSQFINDDALKEAFPFAEPDLLVIPKDTETVEEQIADELGKQEGSPDGKEGCQPRGGEASFASKKEETEPEKEHPSEAAEVASETVQITQEANGYSSGEKMRGDAPEDEEKPTRCEVAGEEQSEKEPSSEGAEETSETIHIMQEANGDSSREKMRGDAPEDEEKPTRCEVAGEGRSEKEPSSEGAEETSETIHIMQEGNGDASGVKMQGDAPEDKEKE